MASFYLGLPAALFSELLAAAAAGNQLILISLNFNPHPLLGPNPVEESGPDLRELGSQYHS